MMNSKTAAEMWDTYVVWQTPFEFLADFDGETSERTLRAFIWQYVADIMYADIHIKSIEDTASDIENGLYNHLVTSLELAI